MHILVLLLVLSSLTFASIDESRRSKATISLKRPCRQFFLLSRAVSYEDYGLLCRINEGDSVVVRDDRELRSVLKMLQDTQSTRAWIGNYWRVREYYATAVSITGAGKCVEIYPEQEQQKSLSALCKFRKRD